MRMIDLAQTQKTATLEIKIDQRHHDRQKTHDLKKQEVCKKSAHHQPEQYHRPLE